MTAPPPTPPPCTLEKIITPEGLQPEMPKVPNLKLETRGLTEQEYQAQLWPSAVIHANTIAAKLRSIGRAKEALSLEDCHTRWTFAQCDSCHAVSRFPNRCENLHCPKCQPFLSRKRRKAVEWWAKLARQPKHVVLTVQNCSHLTKEHLQQVKKWFRALRRSTFAKNWIGGFYSMEVTNEGKGWHIHIHALIDARWIDSFALSQAWQRTTNSMGRIVKVKDARARDYLQEVTKYAVKGSQLAAWTPQNIATFIDSVNGVRTFGVFGSLYGKRTEWKEWLATLKKHGRTCDCGCTDFHYYSETEWLLLDLRPGPQYKSLPPPEEIQERQNTLDLAA